MTARIIDGKALAKTLRGQVKREVAALPDRPRLVAVEVGHDEASASYTRNQARTAERLGIEHRLDHIPETASEEDVRRHLNGLNEDPTVHAVMLQMPLPRHLDEAACRRRLSPEKDVEAVTETSAGRLMQKTHVVAPCTAAAALHCLEEAAGGDLTGMEVCVIGRSAIVGRPLALLLTHADATVTVCHTRTRDLPAVASRADAVVAAAGVAGLVTADMVREGALVVDVGTNWQESEGKLVGDVRYDEVAAKAAAITPVPGGVGPVTVAMLMRNVLVLARRLRAGG